MRPKNHPTSEPVRRTGSLEKKWRETKKLAEKFRNQFRVNPRKPAPAQKGEPPSQVEDPMVRRLTRPRRPPTGEPRPECRREEAPGRVNPVPMVRAPARATDSPLLSPGLPIPATTEEDLWETTERAAFDELWESERLPALEGPCGDPTDIALSPSSAANNPSDLRQLESDLKNQKGPFSEWPSDLRREAFKLKPVNCPPERRYRYKLVTQPGWVTIGGRQFL